MNHFLRIVVLVSFAACKSKDGTPHGATVLSWDTTKATRASFAKVVIGARATRDVKVEAHPTDDALVRLDLHIETAPVTFEEDGKPQSYTAPVAIHATVDDGGEFVIADGGCQGPDFQFASGGTAPKEMLVHCAITTKKPRYDMLISLTVFGDGTATPTFPADKLKIGP